MAAGVAHEVRNPLMAIKILVQAAAERGEQGQLRGRDLRVLEEEVVRLERLTSTFLDFARPPRPERRRLELGQLLGHTLELVAGRADLRGVRVESTLGPGPLVLDADRGQLHQLLFNLLLNALDASPPGAAVRVAARAEGAGGARSVRIEVRDAGPGLPRELGERIFEPFVSTKETGLGLGLSICRRVVEDHGGTITAAGGPGGGAVFTVRLPAPEGSAPPGAADEEAGHAELAGGR
jgi:signal transduction histidine kinase